MPDYGATDRVRDFVVQHLIDPARYRGERTITIHAGTLGKLLEEGNILPANRFPIICGAMGSPKFAKKNRIVLQAREGPRSGLGSSSKFTFALQPVDQQSEQSPAQLAKADADSFLRMRGLLKDVFASLGGGEAFLKSLREDPPADKSE